MKKFSYILISGILGLVISSCGGTYYTEHKTIDLETATLNLTFGTSTAESAFDICFELRSDVKSTNGTYADIGDFKSETSSHKKFCRVAGKSNGVNQIILIPKSFKYVYYENDKATETIDHTSGELTYTVKIRHNSEVYRTFKVTPETTTVDLTL